MDSLRTILNRIASHFRHNRLDCELDEELRAHIEMAILENRQRGMSQREARTAALRSFGGVAQMRESYRRQRGLPWLDQIMRDLRFGARQLFRAPGFALTAIGTLALGLGANTAVFSLINELLLRPLPVPHAVVRLAGPAASLATAARRLAAQMAPDIPAPEMTTMSSQLDESISSERTMAILAVFFAICALLVTAIGLYGTLAYATARRTSEIGVRMALGAQRAQVAVMVFRENAWAALCGSAIGIGAALLAGRALESFLYGTSARDPWVLAASVLALTMVASAASLLPAIRAASLEPMEALRAE